MDNFEFKDMIRMEINTCRIINVEGMGKVTVLKVPRGWVYYTYDGDKMVTSTFVPEREKQPHYNKPEAGPN